MVCYPSTFHWLFVIALHHPLSTLFLLHVFGILCGIALVLVPCTASWPAVCYFFSGGGEVTIAHRDLHLV